jgi:hypothetical protein
VRVKSSGRVSSVGLATRYGLDCPGIESRWAARLSAPVQTSRGVHPASSTMDTGSVSYGMKRPGRGVDHPPLLASRLKSRAVPLLPAWAVMVLCVVNFTL